MSTETTKKPAAIDPEALKLLRDMDQLHASAIRHLDRMEGICRILIVELVAASRRTIDLADLVEPDSPEEAEIVRGMRLRAETVIAQWGGHSPTRN